MISKFKNPCNKCLVKPVCKDICQARKDHAKFLSSLSLALHISLCLQPFVCAIPIAILNLGQPATLIAIFIAAATICLIYWKLDTIIDKHKRIYMNQLHKSLYYYDCM